MSQCLKSLPRMLFHVIDVINQDHRYGNSAGKQVFKCKDCLHKFREPSLLKRARFTPELVSLTLDLYFSGLSLRKIANLS